MAQQLYKAGKIKDLCEDADFYTRLTKLESQYPNASVLVHKQGVLPQEIANLWSSPQLMSAACQFLGGKYCLICFCMAWANVHATQADSLHPACRSAGCLSCSKQPRILLNPSP